MQFVCMLWSGRGFSKPVARYSEEDVVYLASALERFGHKLLCVTDTRRELPDSVGQLCLSKNIFSLPDYLPKLWLWSKAFRSFMPKRFAYIDLDVILLDDPASVFNHKHPVMFWDFAKQEPYNTSLFVCDKDFGLEIWDRRAELPKAKLTWPRWTGDQSFVGHILGPGQATFGPDQGIVNYSSRWHPCSGPPKGIKAVFFCGPRKPADLKGQVPWVTRAIQVR